MNDNVKAWIKDLTSGEYKQGKTLLNRIESPNNTYCCLGVACETYIKAGNSLEKEDQNEHLTMNDKVYYGTERQTAYLPLEVMEWLELSARDGKFDLKDFYAVSFEYDKENNNSLADMNDNGHTFAEIVEMIGSDPEGLFITS